MLNEVYIQFTIESSTKTPIEITKYLDMEATKTWLKNDFSSLPRCTWECILAPKHQVMYGFPRTTK
jgi:hypothetical protein